MLPSVEGARITYVTGSCSSFPVAILAVRTPNDEETLPQKGSACKLQFLSAPISTVPCHIPFDSVLLV